MTATLSKSLKKRVAKYGVIYLLIAPVILYFIIYKYLPMAGLIMAFKDYKIGYGIWGIFTSKWVGLEHFERLFKGYYFSRILWNTVIISLMKLAVGFPLPILFALMLNEVRNQAYKRTVQTISYLPHFLSAVVMYGLVTAVFSPTYGLINSLRVQFGMDTVYYMANTKYFRWLLVLIDTFQHTGWNAIIYLAAMTSIDPGLYEAATIDGAGRFQRIRHITLPSLSPLIVLLFILSLGGILDAGFEMVLLMYSPTVYSVGDIIDTYAYREAIFRADYDFATAVGLFKSIVGLILVFSTNTIVKRLGGKGIW